MKKFIEKRYDIVAKNCFLIVILGTMGKVMFDAGLKITSLPFLGLTILLVFRIMGTTVYKEGCFSIKKRGKYYVIVQSPFMSGNTCAIRVMKKAGNKISKYIVNNPDKEFHCKTHETIIQKMEKNPDIVIYKREANLRELTFEKFLLRLHIKCLKCKKKSDCYKGKLFKGDKEKKDNESNKTQFYYVDIISKKTGGKRKATTKQLYKNIVPLFLIALVFYGFICYKSCGHMIYIIIGIIGCWIYFALLDALFHELGHYLLGKFFCLVNKRKTKVKMQLNGSYAFTEFETLDVYTDNQIRVMGAAGSVFGMIFNIIISYIYFMGLAVYEWKLPASIGMALTFCVSLAYALVIVILVITLHNHHSDEMNDVTAMYNPKLYRQLYNELKKS